jgi:hypothetical protein
VASEAGSTSVGDVLVFGVAGSGSLCRFWHRSLSRGSVINCLTGKPILPARTANQYLARYWSDNGDPITGLFIVLAVSHGLVTVLQNVFEEVPGPGPRSLHYQKIKIVEENIYPSHTFLTKFVSRGSTSLLPSRSYITHRYKHK